MNKLFRTNSLKTIQADQEKYAMYCAKQKNLDIDAFYLKGLLVSSSETDEKNQSTQNQGASENNQTQDISNLSLISSRVDKLIEFGNKITTMLSNQAHSDATCSIICYALGCYNVESVYVENDTASFDIDCIYNLIANKFCDNEYHY